MAATAALGIVCKAPQPGRAKTRLAAAIGSEAAASFSECFLRDVAASIAAVPETLRRQGYGIYAPAGAESELRRILPVSFQLLLQADADFGNVLFGAARHLIEAGHDCAVLINGDSPTLPPRLLVAAVAAIRQPGDRVVLGPAADGGYYLIAIKSAHRHLFDGIPWGTSAVTAQTLAHAREINLEAECLPEWYDVDDAESFSWLRDELGGRSVRFKNGWRADATRALLARHATAAQ
jgi:rSAM/selenodomain-associated transferase 1